jgi:excisionase family DNA binding protein
VKQYLTSGEAARICGVHINTIKGWVRKGEIEAVHSPGGRWRILTVSLVRFLQANGMPVPEEYAGYPHRILVVDDDPAVCKLVSGALKLSSLSCEISSASNGYDGLIKIGELKPDLLVLDIMMPEMNGLELMQRLRANPDLSKEMRILVLTGAKDSELMVRNIEAAGPDELLFKPVGIIQLLESIQRLISRDGQSRSGRRS